MKLVVGFFVMIFVGLTAFALIGGRHEQTDIDDSDRTVFEDPRQTGTPSRYQAKRFPIIVRSIDLDVSLDILAPTAWRLRLEAAQGRILADAPAGSAAGGSMVISILCFQPCEASDNLDLHAQRQGLDVFGLDRDDAVRDEPILGGWLVEMEPDAAGVTLLVQRYDDGWPLRVSCLVRSTTLDRGEIDDLIGACAAIEARFP